MVEFFPHFISAGAAAVGMCHFRWFALHPFFHKLFSMLTLNENIQQRTVTPNRLFIKMVIMVISGGILI
jgi:hypothetical protein